MSRWMNLTIKYKAIFNGGTHELQEYVKLLYLGNLIRILSHKF